MESKPSSSNNSFLKETEYNSDIGSDIRKDINDKFSKSKANLIYVFPRSQVFRSIKKPSTLLPSTIKTVKLSRSSKKPCYLSSNSSIIKPKISPILKFPTISTQNSSLVHKQLHKKVFSESSLLKNRLKHSPYFKPVNSYSKLSLIKRALL